MSGKMTLPPIPNALNVNNRDLGSLDPHAFRRQFTRSKQLTAYQEIATLSSRTESLRQENDMMRHEMFELVTTNENPYCQLKRALLEFDARLAEREKEASEIKKYYNGSSVSSTPTFVEVDIHVDKKTSFDLFATSLLVCNEQRSFFKANDLRRQNEELMALIEHQEETLKMIQARLRLYWQCQHKNSAKLMIDSLKRGEKPPELADAAPNQLMEQKMKIKLLSNELRQLVQQRKELTSDGKFVNRIKIRTQKRMNEMAIKIQKYFRGFMARLNSPLPKKTKPQFVVHEPPPRDSKPPRNSTPVNLPSENTNENSEINNVENNENVENSEIVENNSSVEQETNEDGQDVQVQEQTEIQNEPESQQ